MRLIRVYQCIANADNCPSIRTNRNADKCFIGIPVTTRRLIIKDSTYCSNNALISQN